MSSATPAASRDPVPPIARLPVDIWLGVVLALIATALTGVAWVWNLFPRLWIGNGGFIAFIAFQQIYEALLAARDLVVGVGLFLIFNGLGRRRIGTHPWTLLGSVLILAGSVALTCALAVYAVLLPQIFSTPLSSEWFFSAIGGVEAVGSVAVSLGIVGALYGAARGALTRPAAPMPPPMS